MKLRKLYMIVGVALLINTILFSIFLIKKSPQHRNNLTTSVIVKTPLKLIFQNNSNLIFDFDATNARELSERYQLIKDNKIYNFSTEAYYSPNTFKIIIKPLINSQAGNFVERVEANGEIVYAYNVDNSPESTTIEIYFEGSYFTKLRPEELVTELDFFVKKTLITLGTIAQKQAMLSQGDRKEIIKKTIELNNFHIINVSK